MENPRTKSGVKSELEVTCEKVMEKEGTLRTQGVALAIEIRQAIDRCYSFGISSQEVHAIIAKFDPFTN